VIIIFLSFEKHPCKSKKGRFVEPATPNKKYNDKIKLKGNKCILYTINSHLYRTVPYKKSATPMLHHATPVTSIAYPIPCFENN